MCHTQPAHTPLYRYSNRPLGPKGRSPLLQNIEIAIIRAIQSVSSPFFDAFFTAVSDYAATVLIVALALLSYFLFDKKLGRRLIVTGFFAFCINGVLKDALRFRRPIGIEGIRSPGAESLEAAYSPDGYGYSYSFPSGHTGTAATTWSTLGFTYKRWYIWLTGLIVTLLVGVSRLYLGVHFPRDVLAGMALGFVAAGAVALAEHYLWDTKVFYTLASLLLLGALFLGEPSADTVKGVAGLCGFTVGCWVDDLFVDYKLSYTPLHNYLALGIGVALLGGLFIAMKLLLPDTPVCDFARYFTLLFVMSGPYLAAVMAVRRRGAGRP